MPGEAIAVNVDLSAATQLVKIGVLSTMLLEPRGEAGDAHASLTATATATATQATATATATAELS